MAQLVLLDAGPLVAVLDRREQWHEWAVAQMSKVQTPLLTCEAVITEVCFLLRQHPSALHQLHHWAEQGLLKPLTLSEGSLSQTFALMQRYANVPMSFADASLMMHAEALPHTCIFTLDKDFTIYRHVDGKPPSLMAPFVE